MSMFTIEEVEKSRDRVVHEVLFRLSDVSPCPMAVARADPRVRGGGVIRVTWLRWE